MKKIKSAVIGYGGTFNMGKQHALQMNAAGFELTAVCDLDPKRVHQAKLDFPNIRTYTNIDELLKQSDIDLITIIIPHNTHANVAEQVLKSGKHCILEKPMCIYAEEADKLVQLALEKQRMLTVFHNRRWDGWYLTLQDLIQKDILGDIFQVELFFGGYRVPENSWRVDKKISGGAFYDFGAHFTDWLLGIIPEQIKSVRGYIHNRMWHHVTNEDQVESVVEFENGAIGRVLISSISRAPKPNALIQGTKGSIVDVNMWDGNLTLYTEVNGLTVKSEVPCLPDNHQAFYDNVADHLYNGAELFVKPEQTRRIIDVIETTENSAKKGMDLPLMFENIGV